MEMWPETADMDRRINTEELKYRMPCKIVAILDVMDALGMLGFHSYTIFAQEIHGDKKMMPLSPVGLGLFGYIVVMAWIGIYTCNTLQLFVAVGLYRGTSTQSEATKSLGSCRLWLKTSFFILILLVSKLVILYFIAQLGTTVTITVSFSVLQLVGKVVGMTLVATYLHELTVVFPDISRIYYDTQSEASPKRNAVSDAVWF